MPLSTTRELSVLVVDDDLGDVLMITEALEASHRPHAIEVAQDGEQAMTLLRRRGPDLPDVILLDLNMPRMNGMQLLKVIKDDPQLSLIPVVILTTSKAPTDIHSSYALHANAYVTKPISLEEFTDVVCEIDNFFSAVVTLPQHPGR